MRISTVEHLKSLTRIDAIIPINKMSNYDNEVAADLSSLSETGNHGMVKSHDY